MKSLFVSAKNRVSMIVVMVFGIVAAACATPNPAFDWSTDIGGIKTVVSDTLGANIGAILLVLGFFVAVAYTWKMLRKAGART